jgi:FADH2 O2-dependent halogenase
MLYFAAATAYERRRVRGAQVLGFLSADDPALREIVRTFTDRATNMMAGRVPDQNELDTYEDELRRAIEPYNTAGLLEPDCHNMYRYTALPVV